MCDSDQLVSLGFTDQLFPAGTHICQIFSDDDERDQSLVQFLASGLAQNERTCCFSNSVTPKTLAPGLARLGVILEDRLTRGQFSMAATDDVYFANGAFDPDLMLTQMAAYWRAAKDSGYEKARVIGEMSPAIQTARGGDRLAEYESRISLLLRENPITAVCQYDARIFDGATIMDVLMVHPLMIVRGRVLQNPFFMPPEEYLSRGEKNCRAH